MPRRRQKHSEADLTTYAKPRRGGLSPKAQREAAAKEAESTTPVQAARQSGKSERIRTMWDSMANLITFGVDVATTSASGTVDVRIEQDEPLPLTNFIPNPTGAVERRPGITHEQATSTAVDSARGDMMTLDMVRRARQILEDNHVNVRDMTATEVIAREEERRLAARVQVQINRRPEYARAYQVRTRVLDMEFSSVFDPHRAEDRLHSLQAVAAQHARALGEVYQGEILTQLVRCFEQADRDQYRIDPAYVEAFRHNLMDRYRGLMDERYPELTGAIDWLKEFEHKEFELDGWKANVLDTVEAIKDEGKNMEHCLGGSYTRRIHAGDYIAYHFTPPENKGFPKSGLTLGMHIRKDGKNREYRFDQIKGKKNQTHYAQHPQVLALTAAIDGALNKRKGKAPKKEKEIQRINVDLRPGAINIVNRALAYVGVD
jgi:hypothetical protein